MIQKLGKGGLLMITLGVIIIYIVFLGFLHLLLRTVYLTSVILLVLFCVMGVISLVIFGYIVGSILEYGAARNRYLKKQQIEQESLSL